MLQAFRPLGTNQWGVGPLPNLQVPSMWTLMLLTKVQFKYSAQACFLKCM